MIKKCFFYILVLSLPLFLFPNSISFNETIYISPTGSDDNIGDKKNPIKTLEEGLLRIKNMRIGGDERKIELRLLPGYYQLTNTVNIDQDYFRNISFVGAGAGKTIISGGLHIHGEIKATNNYKIIYLPKDVDSIPLMPQLYIGGSRKIIARTPNIDNYYIPVKYEWMKNEQGGKGGEISVTIPENADLVLQKANNTNSVVTSFLHDWAESRRFICDFNPEKQVIVVKDPISRSRQYFRRKGAMQFFFENDISFLDNPGEYYYDNDDKCFYYLPDKNDILNNEEIIVPTKRMLLSITGSKDKPISNVHFKGISFEYTNYTIPFDGEEPYQASSESLASIMIDYASDICFSDCEFCHLGEHAVWFREGCDNCSIRHSFFHDLGAGAIKIGITYSPLPKEMDYKITRNVVIDNNIITGGGKILFPSVGIALFQACDCSITHNEVSDFFYTGISVGWTWGYADSPTKRNKISYNHVHHLGWGALSDMGGIYTLGPSDGTEITNNIIHHVHSFANNAWGIYLDEGTSNVLVKDNIVYDCKTSAFLQHYGRSNKITNNLLVTNNAIDIAKAEDHLSVVFENNVIYRNSIGPFVGNTWKKSKVASSDNLCWFVNAGEKQVDESSKEEGFDYENPGMKVDKAGCYYATNRTALKKIGFKNTKVSKVGVYGKSSWKALADFSEERAALYDSLTK